ncbi:transmembrane protein 98-like [Ischnura elegans]|uniref:transmembrane protein 98-like n=1 Tax=Ischnura elegans TaxID=197161 RepID=UPI001ED8BA0B|nr:transmembrane protein 98-like [Ischnura elegans]
METVVAFAIGVLATVFVGSLAILVVICRRYGFCHVSSHIFGKQRAEESRQDAFLIKSEKDGPMALPNAIDANLNQVELGEVRLNPDLERMLWEAEEEGGQWIGDASGLIPHCLAILRTCHLFIHCLAPLAANSSDRQLTQRIEEVARNISPRVDDVVRSMYPPLDPIVLEARLSTLVYAVAHLADLILWRQPKAHHSKSYKSNKNKHDHNQYAWAEKILAGVDSHLLALREASLNHETQNHILGTLS